MRNATGWQLGRRCWIAALVLMGLGGGLVSAQDAKSVLLEHAHAIRDAGCAARERKAHACAFVDAIRPADWPLVFETIMEVVKRRDRLELELAVPNPVTFADLTSLDPHEAREEAKRKQKVRKQELERSLRAEEAVLEVFRSDFSQAAARSDPATFSDFAAGRVKVRDPEARANAVRTLGFFPTPSIRRIVIADLNESDERVGLAAVRAVGDHACVVNGPAADSQWPAAFDCLLSGYARAWRDRDKHHRQFLGHARKCAAIMKIQAESQDYLQYMGKLLEAALKAVMTKKKSDLKKFKKMSGKKKGFLKKLSAMKGSFESYQQEYRKSILKMYARDRLIRAMQTTMSCVFGCLTAEQRRPIEETMAKRLAEASHRPQNLRLVELCGYLRSDAIGRGLVGATAAVAAEVRVAACQALGRHGRPEHVNALLARFGETFWQAEIAAIHALQAIGGPGAVNVLVTAMGTTEGHTRDVVNTALRQLTGKDFRGNPIECKQWWDRNRSQYKGPPERPKESVRRQDSLPGSAGAGYFGIQSPSRRIVFVLETSAAMNLAMGLEKIVIGGSMETRFHCILTRLQEAIGLLPEDAVFNVVLYNEKVEVWKPKPSRTHRRNTEAARKWVAGTKPAGAAAVHDALVTALSRSGRGPNARLRATAPDTVYLIAAGPASAGDLAFEADIVDEIEHINRLCQATIHTVGVGKTAPVDFLRALAARCGGRFVSLQPEPARD